MRGRRRNRGSGRGGCIRDRSPKLQSTRRIDDHLTDGHRSPFRHPSRRSLSPSMRGNRILRQSPGRQSSSIERTEYSGFESWQHAEGNRLQPDRGARFEGENYGSHNKYTLPDHQPVELFSDLNPCSNLSSAAKDIYFHHQDNAGPLLVSSGITGHSTMHQKSLFLDDACTFFTSSDTGYLSGEAALKSERVGSKMVCYRDHTSDQNVNPREATFSMVSPSQMATFSGASSGWFVPPKDCVLDLYRDHANHKSDGFGIGSSCFRKFSDDTLEHKVYRQVEHSDLARRRPLSPPARDGSRECGYHDIKRESDDHGFLPLRETHDKVLTEYRDTLRSSFIDLSRDSICRTDVSRKNLSESTSWDRNRALHGDADFDYHEAKVVHNGYIGAGSRHVGLKMNSPRDHEFAPLDERYTRDSAGRTDISWKNLSESTSWDRNCALHRDTDFDYHEAKVVHDGYVGAGSGQVGLKMNSSRDHEFAPREERYTLGRDDMPMAYRERPRSSSLSDRDVDRRRRAMSPARGGALMDNLGIHDLPAKRMVRRNHIMYDDDDDSGTNPRGMFTDDRNVFRRLQSPSGSKETWWNEDKVMPLSSKKMSVGRPQQRMLACEARWNQDRVESLSKKNMPVEHPHQKLSARRVSRPDALLQPGDSSALVQGGRIITLRRRSRPSTSESNDPFHPDKNNDLRPKKFRKMDLKIQQDGFNARDGYASDDKHACDAKIDPPEDSDEFKNQIRKAFLRFSKLLNESSHQQKRYRNNGNAGKLLCSVCGSQSKEFLDTHSLVAHTYDSQKPGLRTDHLGLHQALCVLMGWDWPATSENSKAYKCRPITEANALREDLIIWPPLVIIHNSSIGNNTNVNESKVISVEALEEILRGIGFRAGKSNVVRGRPANQSVFLVKFLPTFSGLQEAERLHRYYADLHHGRHEFIATSSSSSAQVEGNTGKDGSKLEFLYGYMGTAEDLCRLDPETKKRFLVKSKKDIEAIADAPLNAD